MSEIEKPLKESNRAALAAVLVANLAILYLAVQTDTILLVGWPRLFTALTEAIPGGLVVILISILNAQLSSDAKARIVFLKWSNPLPGSYAFSKYAHDDPRVDVAVLEKRYGPLPTEPRQQNVLWYRLYKLVDQEPAVRQVHKQFLFTRDYNALSFMALLGLGIVGVIQIPSITTACLYFAVLLAQFIITGQAARQHGKRFVTTVLATCSAIH